MIKQKTLDLLDSELRGALERYKDYPYDDRYKLYTHPIRIDPYWSDTKYADIPTLAWNGPFKYSDHPNFHEIIENDSIGLYVMYCKPSIAIENLNQIVMYIGISGERGSERPLKDRLADYFNINTVKKRDSVHKMLQLYYDHIYIKFFLFDGTSTELEELEKLFHEYFSPKFGIRDFEPPTKAAQKIWGA